MKTFTVIFTHVYKSDSVAGDAYINKMYNYIKEHIANNMPITRFYMNTKKNHSDMIDIITSMSLKNVEEKYLQEIDNFIEGNFKKQWDPNIWVECMEDLSESEVINFDDK